MSPLDVTLRHIYRQCSPADYERVRNEIARLRRENAKWRVQCRQLEQDAMVRGSIQAEGGQTS